ncbi:MAG: Gfo/Idh/MocA family oxidoreductase, partial [Devosia sp.]|nr:Gfo/Idh/MocA family oxidoreductase [Devosia sp.]
MRILILGTGGMANQHAKHFAAIEGVTLAGGVDVDPARVEAFCTTHNIERGFGSLDAALAWGEFDAVANVTPDSVHHPTTMAALKAGKHVFCEKPLATDHAKAMEMTETAEAAGLINMVNLTYRNVSQLQKMRQIVQSGAVGKVKHFEASYLQSWLVSKAWGDWRTESQWLWRLSKKHGSNGEHGDIGVHI